MIPIYFCILSEVKNMDVRHVQKSGNMYYLYLPTRWCKDNSVTEKSQVSIDINNDRTMTVYARPPDRKPVHLVLKLDMSEQSTINKLIVACYINPMESFKIALKDEINMRKLLSQKKLVSVELVEFDGKNISCESSITLNDPDLLLKTMVTKIKNMLTIMIKNYHKELLERYEEEIDRSRLLIEKAVINSFVTNRPSSRKMIELYYLSQISNGLERMVDHLILLGVSDLSFIKAVKQVIDLLQSHTEAIFSGSKAFDYHAALDFIKAIDALPSFNASDHMAFDKKMIRNQLSSIGETLLDWSITNEVTGRTS